MATVVFDFDGTLHETMVVYREALQRGYDWLVSRGFAQPRQLDDALMVGNIGLTAQEAWARMCPDVPWSVSGQAAARVGRDMKCLIDEGHARLYSGIPEALQQLKDAGHELVFLSNCSDDYCEAARGALGLDAWFDRYYTAEQFDWIPKEQIFETIKRDCAGPYIVVGDRDKDRDLAAFHGLPFVGCAYGYGTVEELQGAAGIADAAEDIPGIIESIVAS